MFGVLYWCNSYSCRTFAALICSCTRPLGIRRDIWGDRDAAEEILPAFLAVPLQWKFYVNKVRRTCPQSRLTAFKENYHLSALFRQHLRNSLEPQASIVLDTMWMVINDGPPSVLFNVYIVHMQLLEEDCQCGEANAILQSCVHCS